MKKLTKLEASLIHVSYYIIGKGFMFPWFETMEKAKEHVKHMKQTKKGKNLSYTYLKTIGYD